MLEYASESFGEALEDFKRLLPVHWREMALRQKEIPLDPDFEAYRRCHELGLIKFYTARFDRELIGYCIMTVTPRHLHYNHRFAHDDTIWIKPEHRNIGVASGLFDFFERDLRRDGPIVIQIETRFGHEALELLLAGRGYGPTGRIFGKRFE